jgi:hypothetical protein
MMDLEATSLTGVRLGALMLSISAILAIVPLCSAGWLFALSPLEAPTFYNFWIEIWVWPALMLALFNSVFGIIMCYRPQLTRLKLMAVGAGLSVVTCPFVWMALL